MDPITYIISIDSHGPSEADMTVPLQNEETHGQLGWETCPQPRG